MWEWPGESHCEHGLQRNCEKKITNEWRLQDTNSGLQKCNVFILAHRSPVPKDDGPQCQTPLCWSFAWTIISGLPSNCIERNLKHAQQNILKILNMPTSHNVQFDNVLPVKMRLWVNRFRCILACRFTAEWLVNFVNLNAY